MYYYKYKIKSINDDNRKVRNMEIQIRHLLYTILAAHFSASEDYYISAYWAHLAISRIENRIYIYLPLVASIIWNHQPLGSWVCLKTNGKIWPTGHLIRKSWATPGFWAWIETDLEGKSCVFLLEDLWHSATQIVGQT